MADNPFAPQFMNPNASRAGLFDLRMMSSANRMETPFEHRMSYGRQGLGGNPMLNSLLGGGNTPDYSQFTFDPQAHAAASQALAPYGLSPLEANQVHQNTILPNSGFFGRHSRLSAALEGGMYGALAAHGGETVGDSIQGALEGVVGGRQLQQGMYNKQFARPFEAANLMESFMDRQQKRELQEADIQHLRAENQKLGRPDHAYTTHALTKSDPGYVTTDTTTGESKYTENPAYDPSLVERKGANVWAGLGHLEPYARARGLTDPNSMTKKDWAAVNGDYEAAQSRIAFGKGKSGTEGRLAAPGELTPQQKEQVDSVRAQMNKLDSKDETSRLRQEVLLDPAWSGKPLNVQNQEVERRRESRRSDFQSKIDGIMNPKRQGAAPPEAKGAKKVYVEGRDF